MIKKTIIAFVAGSLILTFAGCESKPAAKDTVKATKPPKSKGHAISKKDTDKILKATEADIKILEETAEDPSKLSDGFSREALTSLTKAHETDLAAGKIKIRVFKESKVTSSFAAQKLAAIAWTYKDGSYYIDKNTKQPITSPTNKDQVFNLAVVKEEGRWKIGKIMLPAEKPPETPKK